MSVRRDWLKQLASLPTVEEWANACDAEVFAGMARVETRNTTYLFRNGNCFGVTHRDERGTSSAFVGMRIVGWLLTDGEPRLSRTWQLGACAVLWGTGTPDGKPIALTSPSSRFSHFVTAGRAGGPDAPPNIDRAIVTLTRINMPRAPAISSVRPVARAV